MARSRCCSDYYDNDVRAWTCPYDDSVRHWLSSFRDRSGRIASAEAPKRIVYGLPDGRYRKWICLLVQSDEEKIRVRISKNLSIFTLTGEYLRNLVTLSLAQSITPSALRVKMKQFSASSTSMLRSADDIRFGRDEDTSAACRSSVV